MDTLDVCPTEDAVRALLEYLVDPLLPAKPSTRDIPSHAVQETVAKQVHAVVLLYNYYHRRKHPHLEYLSLEAFCKLATVFRPSLLLHMKLMKEPGDRAVNNIWEQTSLLERIIMDACDLCIGLDALPDMPSVEDWPIQKVVVFLVDSKRKNCYLQHSFITQGVWSLIEKAIGDSNHSSECKLGQGCVDKEEKSAKCRQGHEAKDSEIVFKELALSAVKEATGVNRGVIILERHVAYSLSKERTTARFYIMQCTSENSGLRTVPIEDVINSLEGPLFENSSSLWTITPVVEYFHILPFANILSDWFSRPVDINIMKQEAVESSFDDVEDDGSTDISEDLKVPATTEFASSPGSRENAASRITDDCHVNASNPLVSARSAGTVVKDNGRTGIAKKPKVQVKEDVAPIGNVGRNRKYTASKSGDDDDVCPGSPLLGSFHGQSTSDGNGHCLQKDGLWQNRASNVQTANSDKRMCPFKESHSNAKKNGFEVEPDPKVSRRIIDQRETGVRKRKTFAEESQTVPITACSNRMPDSVAVSSHHSNLNLDKLQAVIVSKAKLLSEAALKVLLCKRDKLILQHRNIEDEIAKCDKSIQTIMEGGEDYWELKLDLIIESCNDSCPRSIARKADFQHSPDNLMLECNKRIKLSDPFPRTRNPCQELDDLCYDNNWLLPTYHVSPSDDGYKAKVRLKDMRSMHKACGFPRPNPREARESAASALLTELHSPQSLD